MAKKTSQPARGPAALLKDSAGGALRTQKTSGGGRSARARVAASSALAQTSSRAAPVPRPRRVPAGTVIVQARIDAEFARELVEVDALLLGLEGTSALVREGLRLLHRQARELAMAEEYDKFYGGASAPLPDGVAAVWVD
jgi:hypothetical protein